MRTNIVIDDKPMRDALRATGLKTVMRHDFPGDLVKIIPGCFLRFASVLAHERL